MLSLYTYHLHERVEQLLSSPVSGQCDTQALFLTTLKSTVWTPHMVDLSIQFYSMGVFIGAGLHITHLVFWTGLIALSVMFPFPIGVIQWLVVSNLLNHLV